MIGNTTWLLDIEHTPAEKKTPTKHLTPSCNIKRRNKAPAVAQSIAHARGIHCTGRLLEENAGVRGFRPPRLKRC